MHIREQLLPGVFLLDCPHHADNRGSFTKLYHFNSLKDQGITFSAAETFLTQSSSGVVRGMHFQVAEAAHDKLICCLRGSILDVIVDIQPSSPNFNKPISIQLTEDQKVALLIQKGYAHGFLSRADDSMMLYGTSTIHSPDLDRGVLWSSIDFDWPINDPILSLRDKSHPSILEIQ